MLGSASSISCANTVLNTTVAEELKQFADELEGAEDFEGALHDLIKKTIKEHKRIIFNGDGYDESWVAEAEKRGLSNLKTTPDALAHMLDKRMLTSSPPTRYLPLRNSPPVTRCALRTTARS